MKLLDSVYKFKNEFLRLQENYNEYYWAIAWAGAGFESYEELKRNNHKIKEIIVGLHFYQTHPKFIEEFLNESKIKYIKQTSGTFHPKVYLFQNNDLDWEIILGSPNFTNAAFSTNNEISVLISPDDVNAEHIYFEVKQYINKLWNEGGVFNATSLIKYSNSWKMQKSKIRSLSGSYGENNRNVRSRLIFETETQGLLWQEYLEKVKNEVNHNINDRISVIKIAGELFKKYEKFNEMETEERKFIAGIPNNLEYRIPGAKNWAFFGSMKAVGIFKHEIIENNNIISVALEQIPLSGQITEQHYLNFWEYFKELSYKIYFVPATRLLCMKRPDTFVCLSSKNRKNLCNDFGIPNLKIDKDNYWNEIIERIFDSNWWQNPKPNRENESELIISNARAAFLDSIFYEE